MKPTIISHRVVAAHREPILNAGIADILRQCPDLDVAVAESNGQCSGAALVITDCQSAVAGTHRLPVLIVDTWPNERTLLTMRAAGIRNYVLQGANAAELHAAVGQLLGGGNYFSPALYALVMQMHTLERPTRREGEVLALLAKGYCNKRIAQRLGIQQGTVKAHMQSLMGKLGAGSRTEALALAYQRGMVELAAG
jgi:DNA-binding NarL/FixJ family response regulator